MTITLTKGRYGARIAKSANDVTAAQALRYRAFEIQGNNDDRLDSDSFDPLCTHFLIEDDRSGQLVCCFRVLMLDNGSDLSKSYSGQRYDLSALSRFPGPMLELGRFCIHPDRNDPDILRVAWGALTRLVDETSAQMLFGCSSFKGVDTRPYKDAFALLRRQYLGPVHCRPRIKAPEVRRFERAPLNDAKQAVLSLPSLLRSYLAMGGWVSDHAVVDREMNTLHVFTGLEIDAIPAGRKRLLRAMAS